MAQKTGKEETEFKVPETITLCVNNCGLVGNPATNNMCQKCFAATTSTASTTTATNTTTVSTSVASNLGSGSPTPMKISGERSPRSRACRSPDRLKDSYTLIRPHPSNDRAELVESTASEAKRTVNRCSGCRRKVGLTGFRCRCGELFCAEHRYSDRHDCSYDYKAAGREAIVRENPVVKAAKIVRV